MREPKRDSLPVRVNPDVWVQTVRNALHTAGYRSTEPRNRVLKRIAAYRIPFTAEQLYAEVQHDDPPPGRATVYRTLEQLYSAGWVARIHTSTIEMGYIASWPGHLHHLVCTSCGTVIAFEGCALDELLARLSQQTNFRIEGHLLQIYGRCASCQQKLG